MVVKMMKWRPWPPILSRKFEVKLVVKKMEGGNCDPVHADPEKDNNNHRVVEIKWKGPKITLGSFRRTVKREFTKGEILDPNGVVLWDQDFHSVCTLSGYKDNDFLPWEIGFKVLNVNGSNAGLKNKVPLTGKAYLNLAEYVSLANEKEFEINISLSGSSGATECHPSLHISLSLVELRSAQPTESTQSQSQTSETSSVEKDEHSKLKSGLKKVKNFKEYVSIRRGKKATNVPEHEISESRSDEGDYPSLVDFDSLDESHEGKMENSTIRKSFSYGTLAYANWAGGFLFEDNVYYSNQKSDDGCSPEEDLTISGFEQIQNPKRSILPWKKRKLNFKSPKPKGEPLLKKDYGEEGGDDIDFDRRQLSSDESLVGCHKPDEDPCMNPQQVSEFGDDSFAVGNWEHRDIISRDGCMKLNTHVFFASIDQRSEQAAGESACTALVAVIADWFQNNRHLMPIKSQFDSLIRDGSSEWRNLCNNQNYMTRFPDKHFDLETVLEANLRPLTVLPEKSFISFFHPEGSHEGIFDFLHGAMSFDNMWDEISREAEACKNEARVYIVSWNDHFFLLKVDSDAYYIIDTLGERLFEGCDQAYILKFDQDSVIFKLPEQVGSSEDSEEKSTERLTEKSTEVNEVVCRGKESCKEYIKSFLASIPIRELQADIKKGLNSSTLIHHRLQIEFHYTRSLPPPLAAGDVPVVVTATSPPITEENVSL